MDGLKDRSIRILSSDRFNEGTRRIAVITEKGCAFDTIACVFREYSPHKVLPRLFETEPMLYSDDLGLSPLGLIEFIDMHKNELGFEVETAYFPAGMIPFTMKDISENEDLIKKHKDKIKFLGFDETTPEDGFGLRSRILESELPLAVIFNNSEGGHVEPLFGSTNKRTEALSEILKTYPRIDGYITFKKTNNKTHS